jgi:NTE family protein
MKMADAVIGSSSGAIVGFIAASGGDLSAVLAFQRSAERTLASAAQSPAASNAQMQQQVDQLIADLSAAAAYPERAEKILAEMGRMAVAAETIGELALLEVFSIFAGADWPPVFSCTAVSTVDGSFRVWDKAARVDPQLAIAASCAVPGVLPPVTIGDTRWMDGGARDILNADVAAGHDVVLAVSCVLLEVPPELSTPAFFAPLASTRTQLDSLRAGGSRVATIVPGPEMLEISEAGANLMDFTRVVDAYEAGLRQGRVEAARLAPFWNLMATDEPDRLIGIGQSIEMQSNAPPVRHSADDTLGGERKNA